MPYHNIFNGVLKKSHFLSQKYQNFAFVTIFVDKSVKVEQKFFLPYIRSSSMAQPFYLSYVSYGILSEAS